jgi:hypothetical protein
VGTQASPKGPRDKQELLPAWALLPELPPADGGEAPSPPDATPDGPDVAPGEPAAPTDSSAVTPPDSGPQPTPIPDPPPRWTLAKKSLGAYVALGGGGGASARKLLRRSARRYVAARGGAGRAARASTSGRAATAALGGFLSNVARGGFARALDTLGLSGFAGSDAQTVLSAIENVLAPAGASREDAAARRAIGVALDEIYERFGADEGSLEALDRMSAEDIRVALTTSVAEYIYARWLSELGRRLEDRAVSPEVAVRLERDIHGYLREAIVLDLKNRDPLTLDWSGDEGRALIEGLYAEAFGILGGGA